MVTMDSTRALSLALLVVGPFTMALEIAPDYPIEDTIREQDPVEHLYDSNPSQEDVDEHLEDWSRRKRAVGTPEEALVTDEQVVFNPFVYHRQIALDQAQGELHRLAEHHPSSSSPPYVFRGTPFGAVFVKHQLDTSYHHKQQ